MSDDLEIINNELKFLSIDITLSIIRAAKMGIDEDYFNLLCKKNWDFVQKTGWEQVEKMIDGILKVEFNTRLGEGTYKAMMSKAKNAQGR